MNRDPRTILEERARALASGQTEDVSRKLPVTVFSRGGQRYAFRVEEVQGAGRLRDLSSVPGAPDYILGAVQHRGEVVAMIDLVRLWGEAGAGVQDLPTYLVVSDGANQVGLLVEDLGGVQDVDGAPSPYQGVERVGVVEVARQGGEPLLVLSAKKLLLDPRLSR